MVIKEMKQKETTREEVKEIELPRISLNYFIPIAGEPEQVKKYASEQFAA